MEQSSHAHGATMIRERFDRDGWALVPRFLAPREVEALCSATDALAAKGAHLRADAEIDGARYQVQAASGAAIATLPPSRVGKTLGAPAPQMPRSTLGMTNRLHVVGCVDTRPAGVKRQGQVCSLQFLILRQPDCYWLADLRFTPRNWWQTRY